VYSVDDDDIQSSSEEEEKDRDDPPPPYILPEMMPPPYEDNLDFIVNTIVDLARNVGVLSRRIDVLEAEGRHA